MVKKNSRVNQNKPVSTNASGADSEDRRARARKLLEELAENNRKAFNDQLKKRSELDKAVGRTLIDPSASLEVPKIDEPDPIEVQALDVPSISATPENLRNVDLPVETVSVEYDDEATEVDAGSEGAHDPIVRMPPVAEPVPDYEYTANRDIKFSSTPIDQWKDVMQAGASDGVPVSQSTKDSVKMRERTKPVTPAPPAPGTKKPFERANKTVSPEDDGVAIELPEDPDEAKGVDSGVERRDTWEQPKTVDVSWTEKESARAGLFDRIRKSEFWRYTVRGEVIEDAVKVGADVRAVEKTVLVSKLFDFVGTVSGSRILVSGLAALYQKGLVSEEQRRIIEATTADARVELDGGEALFDDDVIHERAERIGERIAQSKYLTADKKRLLELKLKQLVDARDSALTNLEQGKINEEIVDIISRTLKAREDITTVSRDAINFTLQYTGLFALRLAGYGLATSYKAVRRWEGEAKLGLAESKGAAAAKEFTSWWNKLRGKDEGRRLKGMAEAVLTALPTVGVVYQASDWSNLSEMELVRKLMSKIRVEEVPEVTLHGVAYSSDTAHALNQGEDAWSGNGAFDSEAPEPEIESSQAVTDLDVQSQIEVPGVELEQVPEIATVRSGDGVTWILMRQFKDRADELGYDATKDGDVHEWARQKALALARAKGYLDEHGFETRIKGDAVGSIGLVLNEEGDGFTIVQKTGELMSAGQRGRFFEDVEVPAASTPELSTTSEEVELPVDIGTEAPDDVELPEPEPEVEQVTQAPEVEAPTGVAEIRVDSYGKMKAFETIDGRYTLDLSKFEVRRRHLEMMRELAISPDDIDTPEERAFFQKLFAYAYTLDEMRKQGEEGGRVYTGLAKEANRLFVMSYSRMGVEVNPGNPLILPLLKPEYRIR